MPSEASNRQEYDNDFLANFGFSFSKIWNKFLKKMSKLRQKKFNLFYVNLHVEIYFRSNIWKMREIFKMKYISSAMDFT